MRISTPIILTALLIALLSASTAALSADATLPFDVIQLAQRDGMTLDQAVEQVRRQYGGRIVSAETRRSGNREVHHIKVLTADGKVKSVQVPGRTIKNG
jgi:uncharacterized membrane protein YkoI